MKAGDVIVISGKSFGSNIIKGGTISRWSHVGIAINEKDILEANVKDAYSEKSKSGIYITEKEKFICKSRKALLLIRPDDLREEQLKKLYILAEGLKGTEYGMIRAINSNGIPLLRNIYSLISLFFLCLAGYGLYQINYIAPGLVNACTNSSCLIELTNEHIFAANRIVVFIALAFILFFVFKPFFSSGIGNKNIENYLTKLGLSDKWINDKGRVFCSQVVADADEVIGGNIKERTSNTLEARPKDIVKICKEILGWKVEDLK